MKKWLYGIVIALLFLSIGLGFSYFSKSSELSNANDNIALLQSKTNILETEIVALRADKTTLETKVVDLNTTLSNREKELKATAERLSLTETKVVSLENNLSTTKANLQTTSKELSDLKLFYDGIFKGKAPPYAKPSGQMMSIIDNTVATDPTWQQLKTFLTNDPTDRTEYVLGKYVCTGFAEDVHNHAEAAGIRCAIVVLSFEDSTVGHALNAFNTTDMGLVFIDCTGVKGYSNKSWDRVAYFRIGEQYGCIAISQQILSFAYEYYEEKHSQLLLRIQQYESNVAAHNGQINSYNSAIQDFNAEVSRYEAAVTAYNKNPTYSEYLRLTAWYAALQVQQSNLNAWANTLNAQTAALNVELFELGLQYDAFGGVLGVINNVEMYW